MQAGITPGQNCKPDSVRSNYSPDTWPTATRSCDNVNLNKSDITVVTLGTFAPIFQARVKLAETGSICERNRSSLGSEVTKKTVQEAAIVGRDRDSHLNVERRKRREGGERNAPVEDKSEKLPATSLVITGQPRKGPRGALGTRDNLSYTSREISRHRE